MAASSVQMHDIYRVVRLCHSSGDDTNLTFRPFLPLILIALACLFFELSSVLIMRVISSFYLSISSRDTAAFFDCLWRALVVVTLVSVCKSLKMYCVDNAALQWRCRLVLRVMLRLRAKESHTLVDALRVENTDQRLTQDLSRLTSKFATVTGTLLPTPIIILLYTLYLVHLFGPLPPTLCFLYFMLGAALTHWQAKKIVPLVYQQERCEGDFRAAHVRLRSNADSVVFLGGVGREVAAAEEEFSGLVRAVRALINTQVLLNVIVNWFSYCGSIGE